MDYSPYGKPSLMTRIGVAKGVGLVIGLVAFFVLPLVSESVDLYTRIGVLLWYPTMGAFIGVFGVMNKHPLLQLPLPWWFRGPLVGAWMNLVLVFFAHDEMRPVLEAVFGGGASPFWFVLVGGIAGALIGFITTSLGGEGPETLEAIGH